MSDRKFTFFELHVDGVQIGPSTLPEDVPVLGSDAESDDEGATADSEGGNGRAALGVLVGLGVLVALAAAVRRYRSDDEEPLEDREEPNIVVN